MDPWGSVLVKTSVTEPKFEDNFTPNKNTDKLSDSAEYLAALERKLRTIRKKNNVVDNLAAYRADCFERLMRDGCDLDPVIGNTEAEKLLEEQPQLNIKNLYLFLMGDSKSLFMFLMRLAWKCRYGMPLLLSGTAAALGRAWMFQIRVHATPRLHENELHYYDEEVEVRDDEDNDAWETHSTDSWETIVEEVAYG